MGLGLKSLPSLKLHLRKRFGGSGDPAMSEAEPQGGSWGSLASVTGSIPALVPRPSGHFRLCSAEAVPAVSSVEAGKFQP